MSNGQMLSCAAKNDHVGCYVYLLRDPRIGDRKQSIFYIGKGTGIRPLSHEGTVAEAERELTDAQDDYKLRILREIRKSGYDVIIDVIACPDGASLSSRRALDVEAGLIAALGMKDHGNKVEGHELRVLSHSAFDTLNNADIVSVSDERLYVRVPVSNVWGGADISGTLLGADSTAVWENARHLWSPVATWRAERIRTSDDPVVLLALASNPRNGNSSIVAGVFELLDAREVHGGEGRKGGGYRNDGTPLPEYQGWEFVTLDTQNESQWLARERKRLVGHIPTLNGIPVSKPQDRSYLLW